MEGYQIEWLLKVDNAADTLLNSAEIHNIDFIDLTKYPFTERPLRKRDELMKIIDSLTKNELPKDINLLDYRKDSYWNQYFKEIVGNGIDAASIKKDWELLYKLRCKVAHSKLLDKNEVKKLMICAKIWIKHLHRHFIN